MKNTFTSIAACAALLLVSSTTFAQHFDVEFGYEDGVIVFENEEAGIDGAGIFESEFEVFNPDGTQVAEDPGFASNFMEKDEAFFVEDGDSFFVNVNFSNTLGTYLAYFNPVTNSFETTTAFFLIEDNSPNLTTDMMVTADQVTGDTSQFIVTSSGAEIDSHVDYVLSAGAADGVYGLLVNMESDNLSGVLTDDRSAPFWVLFNNGLEEEDFEAAVENFLEPGVLGDINGDGVADLLDIAPFVDLIISGEFNPLGDINGDGAVDLLDITPFVALISG